jgi:hypothetical protein
MMQTMRAGDAGTVLEFTIRDKGADNAVIDLTAASAMKVVFYLVDKNKRFERDLVGVDLANGVVSYTTLVGDFADVGVWKMQIDITLPTGHFRSEIDLFQVTPNL